MDMRQIVEHNPLLAILRNVPLEKTADYAEAAVQGGVFCFEVALNSPDALKQISLLRTRFGDRCLVGAGTAVTAELCAAALDAGAQFLLTPGTPPEVFRFCRGRGAALLPGVLTPTDVAVSLQYGYFTMKLFPAGSMPMGYVKDLKGPFDGTEYVAIGGVNSGNIRQFLDAGYIGVGLASALMPKEAVAAGDWERCAACVRELVGKLQGGAS